MEVETISLSWSDARGPMLTCPKPRNVLFAPGQRQRGWHRNRAVLARGPAQRHPQSSEEEEAEEEEEEEEELEEEEEEKGGGGGGRRMEEEEEHEGDGEGRRRRRRRRTS